MNAMQLEYYEAGILDANEARSITMPAQSDRFLALCKRDAMPIGAEAIKNLDAYNKGVAFEINRQTSLEHRGHDVDEMYLSDT